MNKYCEVLVILACTCMIVQSTAATCQFWCTRTDCKDVEYYCCTENALKLGPCKLDKFKEEVESTSSIATTSGVTNEHINNNNNTTGRIEPITDNHCGTCSQQFVDNDCFAGIEFVPHCQKDNDCPANQQCCNVCKDKKVKICKICSV